MSKNVIHNFDILIQDSADIKSAEHLTNVMIKALAQISKEMSQQKDIEQLWQEQKDLNTVINNSVTPIEEGAANTNAKQSRKQKVLDGTTSSFQEKSGLSSSVPIGEGVADTFDRTKMNSVSSTNTTSPVSETENGVLNWSSSITTQTYTGLESQETLKVPQTNSNEPSTEVVKAAIKKKLDLATDANDRAAIDYWTKITKAFTEGYTAKDFDGKPNDALFTEMYAALKQSNSVTAIQNFNWEIVREKMIKAINTNILQGQISEAKKERWETIRDQLKKDTTNIANLFEQYNELFLLLREVEGLDDLPGTITITTKTKIYPNLRADRLYADIGREAVYVFLKEISSIDAGGNAVKRGAVKIKNTAASSFIVGESLEFFLDETLIVQNGNKNEGINWIVYKARKGKKDEETIFEDEGTSFSYNFETEGTYKIEAYGGEYGANNKKSKKSFAFVEVKIVAQELVILPPSIVKGRLVRPSSKEFIFKTALKYPKVKSLNLLKFYYQIEAKINNKGTTISDEKELDSTGNIRLLMPDLGTYKIKIISKDQYALTQEFEVSAIKNEVTSIGPIKGESNKNVFLLGGSNKTFTLEAKTFKIPPTAEEKGDVKWIVYDSNNNPYLTSGDTWHTEKDTPKRKHLHKWESFGISVPDKEGHYTIEAFSDIAKGVDAKAVYKMEVQRPQVTEAYWAYSNGDKKKISGFSGEINHVKASIPGYDNQKARINFYLNGSKDLYYYSDTTTNESGEVNKIITFDDTFQRRFRIQEGKTAKISFKIMGIQNDRLYPFKKNASANSAAVLNVLTGEKITDVYFQYDGKRVTAQDEIPLSYDGEYVTIVAKTQNMIGKDIVLTAHRVGEEPIFRSKVKIDLEGNASGTFKITRRKGTKIGEKMSYYVGIEGYSTKHVAYKGLNMVVSNVRCTANTGTYKSHFDDDMIHIFEVEGGYVDKQNDRGGKTNKGITYKTYESFYKLYGNGEAGTVEMHKNLSDTEAKRIYKIEFWNKIHGDEIYNASIATYIFDFAVHSGVPNATKVVQQTLKDSYFKLNVSADGVFGTSTVNSINRVDPKIFYEKLDKNRRKFVEDIIKRDPKQKEYEKGWENRLNELKYKREEFNITQKIESWLKKEYKKSPIKDKNSSIAGLILEAHSLNLVEFNSEGKPGAFKSGLGGSQDTFIKIRDGIIIGNGKGNADPNKLDPTLKDIPIIETALKIIQSNVKNWVDNHYTPKEPNKLKLGSFMVWNNNDNAKGRIAGALRGSQHGNKASAIDINLSTYSNEKIDFSKPNAEIMVLEIIKRLPKGNYGFGFPKQGNFFPNDGKLEHGSSKYNGVRHQAYHHLKSEALKRELQRRMDDKDKITVFPDNPDHFHIQLD
ncbi:glycoside hydrolase family 108 protein [Flavobacterium sp. N502536]|uniref:glycoside hydrolase family 108 protein n=1 Tax=Flavobacterium sp. N502536 TaxID=2986837 RepID=UPI0022222393|nr:glycosyl hydrolase 108 family protein [Flavobacterium sp. N502536]